MGIIDRKEREKEEMRQRILEAAQRLFLEQGFEKTSIRNIADAIEYSPGTIYLYFKDKNDIFFALHQLAFQALGGSFQSVMAIEEPFERLIALGKEYLRYAFENPEFYDLMFLMNAPIESLDCRNCVWEDGHLLFGMLHSIIAACQEKGHFEGKSIDDLSMMIWASVHGLASIHLRKRTLMFAEEERMPRIEKAFGVLTEMIQKF